MGPVPIKLSEEMVSMSEQQQQAADLVVVHWPGKDTTACPAHLRKLVGLAGILGFKLSWTPSGADDTECDNCRTEREKA